MRIKVVLPINHTGLNLATREEIAPAIAPDTEFDIANLVDGPEFIENRFDDFRAVQGIIRIGRQAEQDGFDGIFVDCFTEPGVEVLRECVSIPVLGAFGPALLTANAIAQRYAIITAVPGVVPLYIQMVRGLGQTENVVTIRHVNMPVQEMVNRDRLLDNLFAESVEAVRMGAQAIVLGCTGMLGVSQELQERLNQSSAPASLIDPTLAGICMLQGLIRQRLRASLLCYAQHIERPA